MSPRRFDLLDAQLAGVEARVLREAADQLDVKADGRGEQDSEEYVLGLRTAASWLRAEADKVLRLAAALGWRP